MKTTDLDACFADDLTSAGSTPPPGLSRRSFLQGMAAVALSDAPIIRSDHGRIRPGIPAPDVKLVCQDNFLTTLAKLTEGYATAVQLMFTECTTTCPIQAAIFGRVQRLLPEMATSKVRLLSLSVDPKADTPEALRSWLSRFHAGPNWIAATPSASDGPLIQGFFGRPGSTFADHSTQVNLLDRQGRLVYRTVELPTAEEIVSILREI